MYMDINLCFQTMAYNWPTWVNNSEFLMMDAVKKVFTKSSFFTAFNMGWKALGRKLSIPVCHRAALEARRCIKEILRLTMTKSN